MIGTELAGRYLITGELGRGGMGVVYRARDPLLDREVAVKLIGQSNLSDEAEERFRREAQLVGKMDHPGIVPIYDFGRHEQSLFLVMPVLPGTSLRTFLGDKSLRLGEVIDVGVGVADALEYSHARGVIHRDIKPENIMVAREEGAGLRVRVMDFGLARASAGTRLTQTGVLVGTMAYLSPEQIVSRPADARTDLYALGSVLYECLVGRPPFSGEMQSILYRIVHELPESPKAAGAQIDDALEHVVLSCLAKEPSGRPASAAELAAALRRCAGHLRESERLKSVVVAPGTAAPRPAQAPFVGRKKEMAELQQRLGSAAGGECHFVLLGGDAGSGKTRLADEIANLARARAIRVLRGRFVEQNRALPYQGFCEAIQEYFRQKETGSSSAGPDFSDLSADLLAVFPMLAEIPEIRGRTTRADATAAAEAPRPENKTQVFELLARTLARLAGGKPLLLLLEDLHGAEVSIEALQYVVPRLGSTPTLIIGTYRTTEVDRQHPLTRLRDAFEGDRRFGSLTLGPLTPSESKLLLETLVGGPDIAEDLVEKVHERTAGNPFFARELVRSLLDSGAIAQDDTGRWSLTGPLAVQPDALPATIQQAVERRVQRLSPELRDLLSAAAVLGRTFDFRDLEAVAGGTTDADRAVEGLIDDGLLEEERGGRGDMVSFTNGMIRDVLYAQVSRRRRRSLHRRCAEQIEERAGDRVDRILPQLVYHFAEGDVAEKTVPYALKLAHASLDAFSPDEAVRAARTALEFLEEDWEGDRADEGEARLCLARASRMTGDVDGALREADAAHAVFSGCGNRERALEAIVLAARLAWQARKIEETERRVSQGLEAARDLKASDALRELLGRAATLANLRGEYAKAEALLKDVEFLGAGRAQEAGEEAVPRGGTLVAAVRSPVRLLDPATMEFDEEGEIVANVFEKLLATDAAGNVVPSLAESWEAGDEGRTLKIALREGVTFHDGKALTAEDVRASFERTARRRTPPPSALAAIEGVEEFRAGKADHVKGLAVRGERELEIRLSGPLPIYPAMLTDGFLAIAREGEAGLVGTGPFRLARGDSLAARLERNERYWREPTTRLDAVEFRHGLDHATIAAGLKAEEIDLARDLRPEDLDALLRDPRFRDRLVEAPKKNTYFVLFNSQSGDVGRNAEVRRTLSGVVRAADLVWRTLGRFGQPAVSHLPPGILGHDPGRRHPFFPVEEAKARLEKAGLPAPFRLRALVHPGVKRPLLDALFALWGELGAKVEAQTPAMADYVKMYGNTGQFDLLVARWVADYDDPENFTTVLFGAGGQYREWFASPAADKLMEEARVESRASARESLYRRLEGVFQEEALLLPLFHDVDYRLAGPRVRGLRLQSTPPYVNYAELGKSAAREALTEMRRGGGTIHVPITEGVDDLGAFSMEPLEIMSCIVEGLTRLTADARIIPWLASEYHAEEGGRRYRFRLREDMRFHDGRRVTARDVRYSYERMLESPWQDVRWLLSPIKGAREAIEGKGVGLTGFHIRSATEFTLELAKPVSFFPTLLAQPAAGIVPEGSGGAGRSWQEGLVGTGAFRVTDYRPRERIELERNPHYWRSGYPRSERLVFHFGIAPNRRFDEFKAGRFSICSDLLPADAESLLRDPRYMAGYRETPRLSTYGVAFNVRDGLLRDPALRRALARVLDVEGLARQTLGRRAVPAKGLIPPGLLGHEPTATPPKATAPAGDRPLADRKLKAAIHPRLADQYGPFVREVLRAFATTGAEIEQVTKGMGEFIKTQEKGSADILLGRWIADYPDADTFAHALLHSQEGGWGRMCGSPELDRLCERARVETEPAVRHALYRQIEETLAREALVVPFFHEQAYAFARPEIEGLSVSFWVPVVRYEDLRVRG